MRRAVTGGHQTRVEATAVLPAEIDAGASIDVKVRVSCASGCDLHGRLVQVNGRADGPVVAVLGDYGQAGNESGPVCLRIPEQIGEYAWSIGFEPQDVNGIPHSGSALPFVFRARPHQTTMVAWRAESPVVAGADFGVWIGVSCAAGCGLPGKPIEVRDESGCLVGEGRLGDTVWPGTVGLYVGEVQLRAPADVGAFTWTASIAGAAWQPLHLTSTARFGVRTGRPPECRITVEVVEETTMRPLTDCEVLCDGYQASTDTRGVAGLDVPTGTYQVHVHRLGYQAAPLVVEVTGDSAVRVTARPLAEGDPDDDQWM